MGCGSSSMDDPAGEARDKIINLRLSKDRLDLENEIKILLLGGESGKSTILKQFKLSYQGSFKLQERMAYREVIFSNLIQSMRVLLDSMEVLHIPLASRTQNYHFMDIILNAPTQIDAGTLPPNLGQAIISLWQDQGVQEAYGRRASFQLNDSAAYFFDLCESIMSDHYEPSDQDILRSRVKSVGITETTFKVDKLTYKLFDVGGQRSERKKWIHCFEGAKAVLFVVAISEYDQRLREDAKQNRLEEAMVLFESISNSRWFLKSSIILFLNKTDLFQIKLKTAPLIDYFLQYYGGNDYNSAVNFLSDQFMRRLQSSTKEIYIHQTSAIDSSSMKFVTLAVKDIILKINLRETGFI